MEKYKKNSDDTITGHGDNETWEVDSHNTSLQFEAHDSEVTNVIWTEGKDEDEQGIERDNPEDMLQEDQGPIQSKESLPC